MSKYTEYKTEDKTYQIGKIAGKQVLKILNKIGFISAKPVGSLICTLFYGNKEEKEVALEAINISLQSSELLKENISDLFETINENEDKIEDVVNTILSNTKLTVKNGEEVEVIDFNNSDKKYLDSFSFDDLDEMIELLTRAFKYNLETGLKKVVKKYPFLGLELVKTQEETKQ